MGDEPPAPQPKRQRRHDEPAASAHLLTRAQPCAVHAPNAEAFCGRCRQAQELYHDASGASALLTDHPPVSPGQRTRIAANREAARERRRNRLAEAGALSPGGSAAAAAATAPPSPQPHARSSAAATAASKSTVVGLMRAAAVKTFLDCPFAEKDACKAAGGEFDVEKRKWFVPVGGVLGFFSRWLPAGLTAVSGGGGGGSSGSAAAPPAWVARSLPAGARSDVAARAAVAPARSLPVPSAEQRAVIEAVRQGDCVAVSSVAGSGKTTCMLQVAMELPGKRVLIVAYNRGLKDECAGRIREHGLQDRVSCFTIHGLASRCADRTLNNDQKLMDQVREWDRGTTKPVALQFDLMMLDEAQDLRPSFYQAIRHVVMGRQATGEALQMCVVGDSRQLLYDLATYGDDKANSSYALLWGTHTS